MSGRRRARLLAAPLLAAPLLAAPLLLAASLLLAACGDGEQSAATPSVAPTLSGANPVVAVGTAGVQPWVDPPCPAPRKVADRSDPALIRAAEAITELGEKRYAGSYAGVVPCIPAGRLVVYRVPRANSAFAAAATKIAEAERVDIDFADALFSYRQAQATKKAVLGQFARLDDAGAPFAVLNVHENGTVEVAVRANVPAAEQVLSDLLDRIYVVLIPEESPAPATSGTSG